MRSGFPPLGPVTLRKVGRLALLLIATVVVGLVGPAAVAGPLPPQLDPGDEYGLVLNILPPGQAGTMTATDLARVVASDPVNRRANADNAPANFTDQLGPYDSLNTVNPADLADLSPYFKRAAFTVDEVTRRFERGGVTVLWDSYGVPHIHGVADVDVAWGAGYAGTLDRMFLADVLRHVGRARSAEFLGPSEANIQMDQSILRSAYYTEQEAHQQVLQAFAHPDVPGGVAAAQAFVDGVNAAQERLCPGGLPTGPDCPGEYAALGKQPTAWQLADITFVAALVGGIFGSGGGAEYGNALWWQRLRDRFGADGARQVYEDFRRREDPEAPTTITARTRYGGGAIDPTRPGAALPDLDGPLAGGTGTRLGDEDPVPAIDNLLTGQADLVVEVLGNRLDLGAAAPGMSNAALVSGSHTDDGHPVAVFGPQTGYFVPQLWTEMVLVGPNVRTRGVAFAGTHLAVQIGRGLDYAWSATSASFDNVDTVAERLCEPDGTPPSVRSEHYLRDGACVPMDRRVHEQLVLPSTTDPLALPERLRLLVLRTHHGIVQLRTTASGVPVAVVHQRSTYLAELDSVVGFARVQNPNHITDAASFQRAMHGIGYTFNWFYVDDRDIAYFGSGLLPKRAAAVDWDLPRWGDRQYDWQGFLSFEEHPKQINPPTGYLADWNNKQAPGWHAADDNAGYGPVHRRQALAERVASLVRAGGVTRQSLTAAVQDAAVVDSRAIANLPHLLALLGEGIPDPVTAEAVDLLRAWQQDGALRVDRDRTGSYRHQQAIAIFDEWWESAPHGDAPRGTYALARDILRGGLGDLVDVLPRAIDDHPRHGLGSAWLSSAWYGYVNKELRARLGELVRGSLSRAYCGDGTLVSCREVLRASLRAAVARVLDAQQVSEVHEITYDKHQDDIRFTVAGLVGVPAIDWQNRPTFQQVARFTGHRPR